MAFSQVSLGCNYRYIPLQGWDSVVSAINSYGVGKAGPSSNVASRKFVAESSDPLRECMALELATHLQEGKSFESDILAEAQTALKQRDCWSRHIDYDGLGTAFFKTTVDINLLDRGSEQYALGFYAARVGDQVEQGLADFLGIERGLTHSSVTLEIQAEDDKRFAIDFEELCKLLSPILGSELDPEKIAKQFVQGNDSFGSTSVTFTDSENDIEVSIAPYDIAPRFDWKGTDTWSVNGPILTGPLLESWKHQGQMETPKLIINIKSISGKEFATFDPEKKSTMIEYTNLIARALGSDEALEIASSVNLNSISEVEPITPRTFIQTPKTNGLFGYLKKILEFFGINWR